MLPIADLQSAFLTSIEKKESTILPMIKSTNELQAVQRFNPHINTINVGLISALKSIYPKIWQLVGKKCAQSLAFEFSKDHLPTISWLDGWGKDFPEFLAAFPATASFPYLKDVAIFEWLKQLAYCAVDATPLNPATFKIPLDVAALTFSFHPSCFLFASDYPVKAIMALSEDPTQEEIQNLVPGCSYALIYRPYYNIRITWLTQASFTFFNALKNGLTLEQAYIQAKTVTENFDVQQALVFAMKSGILVEGNG